MKRQIIMKRALAVLLLLLGVWGSSAAAGDKFYIQSIKATNEADPPSKSARAIGARLGEKLSPVFRWKHYWELERREITVAEGELKKLKLSSGRTVELGPIVDGKLQVRLYRGKELVRKTCHRVHDKMMAILGGDDEKHSAWFVVIRREEPQYEIAQQ